MNICVEELPEIMSENPAVKLFAFAHLFHRRPVVELSDNCCRSIRESRTKDNGKFRVDRITNEAIKRAVFECQIVMDDLEEDLLDRQNMEDPRIISELRRGLL